MTKSRVALIAALAVLATPAAALGSVGFSAGQTLSYFGPSGSTLADSDGDGRLDLASDSTGCCQDPGIFPGNGDGTFPRRFRGPGLRRQRPPRRRRERRHPPRPGRRRRGSANVTRPDQHLDARRDLLPGGRPSPTPRASYGEADMGDVDGDGARRHGGRRASKVQMALGSTWRRLRCVRGRQLLAGPGRAPRGRDRRTGPRPRAAHRARLGGRAARRGRQRQRDLRRPPDAGDVIGRRRSRRARRPRPRRRHSIILVPLLDAGFDDDADPPRRRRHLRRRHLGHRSLGPSLDRRHDRPRRRRDRRRDRRRP